MTTKRAYSKWKELLAFHANKLAFPEPILASGWFKRSHSFYDWLLRHRVLPVYPTVTWHQRTDFLFVEFRNTYRFSWLATVSRNLTIVACGSLGLDTDVAETVEGVETSFFFPNQFIFLSVRWVQNGNDNQPKQYRMNNSDRCRYWY